MRCMCLECKNVFNKFFYVSPISKKEQHKKISFCPMCHNLDSLVEIPNKFSARAVKKVNLKFLKKKGLRLVR